MLQHIRRNYPDIVLFSLTIALAFCLGQLIVKNPGMSMTRWMLALTPAGAIGIAIVLSRIGIPLGFSGWSSWSLSSSTESRWAFLLCIALALAAGFCVLVNPLDPLSGIFVVVSFCVLFASLCLVAEGRFVDSVGLFFLSLPFLPYIEYKIEEWHPELGYEWMSFKAMFLLIFAATWFASHSFVRKKPLPRGKVEALLLTLAAWTLLTAFFSTDFAYSMRKWVPEILCPVTVFFIVLSAPRKEGDIHRILSFLVLSVCVGMMLTLYYYAKYGGSSSSLSGVQRLSVGFMDGKLLANTLLLTLPVGVGLLSTSKARLLRLSLLGFLGIGIMSLLLTWARMVQACTCLGAIAFGFKRGARWLAYVAAIAGVLFVVSNFRILEVLSERYSGMGSVEGVIYASTMVKRYAGWRASLKMVRERPIRGIGIGRFREEYGRHESLFYFKWASGYVPLNSAHNLYLTYLAETGIPGALLLLMMIVLLLRAGFRISRQPRDDTALRFSLLVSLSLFLCNSLTDGITFSFVGEIDKGLVFWTLMALLVAYDKMDLARQRMHRQGSIDRPERIECSRSEDFS
ncbi:O-antigen ligase family protein [Elusimicrobiota bacterium]